MDWSHLCQFLWNVTNVFLNVSEKIVFFFSEEFTLLGTTFTRFDLIFGAGLTTYLTYTMIKWISPL